MDGTHRSDIERLGPAARGRPRRPMRAVLVILALTCSAIYAADRAGPFVAGAGRGWADHGLLDRARP